jgi:adenylate cyclase
MSFIEELKRRNVIRVAVAYVIVAWLLLQVSDTLVPALHLPGWFHSGVALLLILGFPLAMIFAWAYELTPDGLKKETDVDRSASMTHITGRKLDFAIIAALVLTLVYFVYDEFVIEPAQESESAAEIIATEVQQSIAVLPFADMSPDKDQEYMSDGIAEEMLNLLAKIPQLRVTARTSAFSFKGKDDTIPEIGVKLNVTYVLEGSVRKAANQIRITAQLIEASTDKHLWSETYTRELEDVFAIQDEIAAEVVSQLQVTLLGELPTVKRIDAGAYALYLQARHLGSQDTAVSLKQSESLFRQVLQLAPGYAPALLGLSFYGCEDFEECRRFSEQAFESDPTYAPAVATLGLEAAATGDLVAAAEWINRALALDADDLDVLWAVSELLQALERSSVRVNEYIVSVDPVNAEVHGVLSQAYWVEGRYQEAVAAARTSLRLSPQSAFARVFLIASLNLMGESKEALTETELFSDSDERWKLFLSSVTYYNLGEQVRSDTLLQEYIDKFPGDYYQIAIGSAGQNKADLAFEYLYKAAEDPDFSAVLRGNFASIVDDPRWAALMEKMGRSPAQLAAIEFEYTPPTHAGQGELKK